MRDVSPSYKLNQSLEEVKLLKQLHMTISSDLLDPIGLTIVSAEWLFHWFKGHKKRQKEGKHSEVVITKEVISMIKTIFLAARISHFKCKDLLAINATNNAPLNRN